MVPGCIEEVQADPTQTIKYAYKYCLSTADELYPELRYYPDTVPVDIGNWMDHRWYLVDAWKTSYNEFRQGFARPRRCNKSVYNG
jgi:hypothetical protein